MPPVTGEPPAPGPVTGVRDVDRLAAVARAELEGHLGDPDLNAVVATLRIACRVPIAVINVVSHNLQTYPAEVGVGAPCTSVPDGLSFCAAVVDTNLPLCVPDARAHPVYLDNPLVREGVIRAYAGVPLVDDGYVLGSVSVFDSEPRDFTAEELEVLSHQARLASSVLALRRSARTDVLTGLANRGLLLDRLVQALGRLRRHPRTVAVMYLDVDGFKEVNDSCGHEVGDQLLVGLAERLSACIRPTDTLARLGGDEFVAVCEDVGTSAAEDIAARMVTAVQDPWLLNGHVVRVDLSIGIALTRVATTPAALLLSSADAAMYQAKGRPGSCWHVASGPAQALA